MKLTKEAKDFINALEIAIVEIEENFKKEGKSEDYCEGYKRGVRTMRDSYLRYQGYDLSENA